jgi:hypothetical protein
MAPSPGRKLAQVLDSCGLSIAVGHDSYLAGAARIASTDETWHSDVERLVALSDVIICVQYPWALARARGRYESGRIGRVGSVRIISY